MGFRQKAASTELEMLEAELDSLRDSLESQGNEQPELRALLQEQTEGLAMTEGTESLHSKRLAEEAVQTFLQEGIAWTKEAQAILISEIK